MKKTSPQTAKTHSITAFNLIILGDPAAGKATQSAHLVRDYHLYNFDMGEILRRPENHRAGKFAKTAGQGKLSPTEFVRGILRKTIPGVKPSQGILFNGHPKMIGEAKIVHRLLKKTNREKTFFIYLTIPEEEMLKRTAKRGLRRADDSILSIRNRMRYYRTHIRSVVEFFRAHYPYKKISSLGTKADTYARITAFIDAEVKKYESRRKLQEKMFFRVY